jgi:lactoylglutathione lyase
MPEVSLNLVVIPAGDLKRSVAFYHSLGVSFVAEKHGAGPEHFAAELGSTVLEIYPRQALEGISGPARLGFRVTSVDDTVRNLRSLGEHVVSGPKDSAWGRRAVLLDPDGHRVEISE